MEIRVNADGNFRDDKGVISEGANVNFRTRHRVTAGYLPVLCLHDNPLAGANVRMERDVGNVNVVARLNEGIFGKGCAHVVLGVNLSPVRARDAAAYVDVAPGDLRAVDGTFYLDVARRLDGKTLLDVALNLNHAVKFNVARRHAHGAFNLKARVDAYPRTFVDNLPVDRGDKPFADDFGIFAFGHGDGATVLRGNKIAQNIFTGRALGLRNANRQRLIFFGEHEQIQIFVVNFIVFVDDGLALDAQIKFPVDVGVFAGDGQKSLRGNEGLKALNAGLNRLLVNAVDDALGI